MEEGVKRPDCELLSTCPFFNDCMYEMAEKDKEQYCKEDYSWCGRYITFMALEKERENRGRRVAKQIGEVSHS